MKLLKSIVKQEIPSETKTRKAARAVLFDVENLVPLLFVSKKNYHKLPGGGIDEGESDIEALKRECIEEAGCEIEPGQEIGMVVEFRPWENLEQTSYCYLGTVLSKGDAHLEEDEIADGFRLEWHPLDEAIEVVKNDIPADEEGKYIQERDLTFLIEAKKLLTGN